MLSRQQTLSKLNPNNEVNEEILKLAYAHLSKKPYLRPQTSRIYESDKLFFISQKKIE